MLIFSLVIPGLGQLYQGRRPAAVVHFVLAVLLWLLGYGWIVHLYSAVEATWQHPDGSRCDT
ncbi:MAG: hypothetical protein OXG98_10680 [Gemmatimonadetes bacterium]|nr:hypothetical protein [Gemmatimonadota bacterium]